jgi:hypothetical protein
LLGCYTTNLENNWNVATEHVKKNKPLSSWWMQAGAEHFNSFGHTQPPFRVHVRIQSYSPIENTAGSTATTWWWM